MWNWPSSSVSHFKGLSYCIFWVPCGTQMVPKILPFESMTSELSNAVSHVLQRILVMELSAIKIKSKNGLFTKFWVKIEVYRNLQWHSRAYHRTLHNFKISIPHYADHFVLELSCSTTVVRSHLQIKWGVGYSTFRVTPCNLLSDWCIRWTLR